MNPPEVSVICELKLYMGPLRTHLKFCIKHLEKSSEISEPFANECL